MSTMFLFIHSNTTLKSRSISPSILSGIMHLNMANSVSMKFSSAHQNHGSKYIIMKGNFGKLSKNNVNGKKDTDLHMVGANVNLTYRG